MSCLTIFLVVFAISSSFIIADDPCRFESTKGVIDLTSLGRTNGTAAYPDVIPPGATNYKYSYNPCEPFSEGDTCLNVSACQVSRDGVFTFILGKQDSAKWDDGSSLGVAPSISYYFNAKTVHVTLECSSSEIEEFEALGEDPVETYTFRLTHKCACWNGCNESSSTIETTEATTAITTEATTAVTTGVTTAATTEVTTAFTSQATNETTTQSKSGGNTISGISMFIIILVLLGLISSS